MASSAVLVAIVNQIPLLLGKATSCWLAMIKVNEGTSRKLQVPSQINGCYWMEEWQGAGEVHKGLGECMRGTTRGCGKRCRNAREGWRRVYEWVRERYKPEDGEKEMSRKGA